MISLLTTQLHSSPLAGGRLRRILLQANTVLERLKNKDVAVNPWLTWRWERERGGLMKPLAPWFRGGVGWGKTQQTNAESINMVD